MALNIIRGKILKAQKVVIYGPEGIGKTTFASQFPDPLYVDTEGGTNQLNVARIDPAPKSWNELLGIIEAVKVERPCATLVLDTADWAEMLCINHLCIKNKWDSIETPGYGAGYTAIKEEFGKLLNKLSDLVEIGINVVFTAHAITRRFDRPDEASSYDRWELKLQRKTAPLVKEWADVLLFANYKIIVENVDAGMNQKKGKARGGKRVMYAEHHPCWDAKNRYGLSGELEFDFKVIEPFITTAASTQQSSAITPQPIQQSVPQPAQTAIPAPPPVSVPVSPQTEAPALPECWNGVLALMKQDNITLEDIRILSSEINHFMPAEMDPANYDPDYVKRGIEAQWPLCVSKIREYYNNQPVPFGN
jgi:hypothetical protein